MNIGEGLIALVLIPFCFAEFVLRLSLLLALAASVLGWVVIVWAAEVGESPADMLRPWSYELLEGIIK